MTREVDRIRARGKDKEAIVQSEYQEHCQADTDRYSDRNPSPPPKS
jgi:hypothetical protein